MTAQLVSLPPQTTGQLATVQLTEEDAQDIRDSKAESTWRAYGSDWRHFAAWCEDRNLQALPADPETLMTYVRSLAYEGTDRAPSGCKVSTITRRLSSIAQRHTMAGHLSPTGDQLFRVRWGGLRNRLGKEGKNRTRKATAATWPILSGMVGGIGTERAIDLRDRALLLLGFCGAFRRSELVSLDLEDITETADGLLMLLRQSKTDQDGQGETKAVPYGAAGTCPVAALRAWIAVAGITSGALFRPMDRYGSTARAARLQARDVARIVKRRAKASGLDPDAFSGHSLRSGLATAAAAAGAPTRKIKSQTGHRSDRVLEGYIQDGQRFTDNAAAFAMGLYT